MRGHRTRKEHVWRRVAQRKDVINSEIRDSPIPVTHPSLVARTYQITQSGVSCSSKESAAVPVPVCNKRKTDAHLKEDSENTSDEDNKEQVVAKLGPGL